MFSVPEFWVTITPISTLQSTPLNQLKSMLHLLNLYFFNIARLIFIRQRNINIPLEFALR